MKYEEILSWRQDVYEQTVLVAQRVPNTIARGEYSHESLDAKSACSAKALSAVQKALPKKPEPALRDIEDWPALPSSNAAAARDRRKSLPLPGGVSPASMVDDVNDLTLRKVPRHNNGYAFDWMTTSNVKTVKFAGPADVQNENDSVARLPTPVPAALAPAQGHATPKVLKRPVSGSFSLNQGYAKSPMRSSNEDSRERSSTTQSSMDRSPAASEAQYAYGLSQHQESDEYGPITPVQGMNEAFPRLMNEYSAEQLADMRASPSLAVFQ